MHRKSVAVAAVLIGLLSSITTVEAKDQCGSASWYGPGFNGKTTASGQKFNQNAMTAAHRTLPFGTVLKVTNQKTGKSIKVVVNDRGPYHGGRILDLSAAAAAKLGTKASGTGKVCIATL